MHRYKFIEMSTRDLCILLHVNKKLKILIISIKILKKKRGIGEE